MLRKSLLVAAALVLVTPLAADAQGWGGGRGYGPGGGWGRGGGYGPGGGRGMGVGAQTQWPSQCLRLQNQDKHATCWTQANSQGLRGPSRQAFILNCMTK